MVGVAELDNQTLSLYPHVLPCQASKLTAMEEHWRLFLSVNMCGTHVSCFMYHVSRPYTLSKDDDQQ